MSETANDFNAFSIESQECKRHGTYQAKVKTLLCFDGREIRSTSVCPACAAEREAKKERDEELERRRHVARLRRTSGVPARFADADFDGYQILAPRTKMVRDILAGFARQWAALAAGGQSLLLVGGPGTGKTHLACAVINAVAEQMVPAQYGTAADLVGGIKRHYGQRGGEQNVSEAIAELRNTPLLVIDEIDVGMSDYDLTLLFQVIDARYARLLPMILISNRQVDWLEQQLGQRVMDRLRECAVTVAFDWGSHRGRT